MTTETNHEPIGAIARHLADDDDAALQDKIDALESKIDELQDERDALQERVDELEASEIGELEDARDELLSQVDELTEDRDRYAQILAGFKLAEDDRLEIADRDQAIATIARLSEMMGAA